MRARPAEPRVVARADLVRWIFHVPAPLSVLPGCHKSAVD